VESSGRNNNIKPSILFDIVNSIRISVVYNDFIRNLISYRSVIFMSKF